MKPLVVENVTKQYADKTAVNNNSFEVGEGEIYGLLGANGAGKTTTMRMVLGLIFPDEGKILYNGKPYSNEQLSKLGYLPEERGLYPKVKVSDQIIYLSQLRGMSKGDADRNLKYWLEKFEVPEYYNKKVEELSKGNQQKIQFIAAVNHKPQIVIMDEAFSGLDPVNVELLKSTVKELRDSGTSILFSTHRMEHVEELCRNITILHRSNTVLKGSLKEIKKRFPRERVILGTDNAIGGIERIAGVTGVTRTEQGYDIQISMESAGAEILKLAMEQANVNHFEIKEPTLNEIFIRTVGDRHE
ncbi:MULTISPECIES: ABC transporter ATP-binding protein [Paenibacillus]|jgi:ABC-2 type transport system ATP-binding protein|uniref:Sodium ABC transporter ATP-binding protein n=1 Tax=Paenibacillus agaridevorans TaxID=171404 RepID=A0A2R5F5V2_9BACL|nr:MULTISPECIES: ATP-binding cassette domain-containing protein [Paenibacillus]QNK59361.1 ATP-binding cassette domain-containing protein [Paenibacillus sp. PAMC21692]GBG11781.1 sodium ABC transporter ATP-binding protein [Paenibacillus agaridevorans]